MNSAGFKYVAKQNGFLVYDKPNISIMMRNCDGYCCEGFIVAKPMSDEGTMCKPCLALWFITKYSGKEGEGIC
jgi:hypothetical protein